MGTKRISKASGCHPILGLGCRGFRVLGFRVLGFRISGLGVSRVPYATWNTFPDPVLAIDSTAAIVFC